MKHRIALAAAMGALSLLASSRDAAAWNSLDPDVVPRWGVMPVSYYINRGTIPAGIQSFAVSAVDSGFAAWAAPSCTEWRTQNLGDTTDSYNRSDGKNVIRWVSTTWPSMLGDVDSVIGVTMPVWGFDEIIDDADIVFNNVGFCWDNSGDSGCVDTQSIATHEEGHFLGLDHTAVSGATMTAFYPEGRSMRTLEADDIDGVCALYPLGGGTPVDVCASCFDGAVRGSCASAYDACTASDACRSFARCIDGCTDDPCVQDCADAFPQGASLYIDVIDCLCGACATECGEECGTGEPGSSSTTTSSSSGEPSSSVSSTTGSGGAGGAGGGAIGAGGAGGAGGAVGATTPKNDEDASAGSEGGCSCSTAGAAAGSLGRIALLVGLGALVARRRRRTG